MLFTPHIKSPLENESQAILVFSAATNAMMKKYMYCHQDMDLRLCIMFPQLCTRDYQCS